MDSNIRPQTKNTKEERRLKSINGKMSRAQHEVTGKLLEGLHRERATEQRLESRISHLESLVETIGGKLSNLILEKKQNAEKESHFQETFTENAVQERKKWKNVTHKLSNVELNSTQLENNLQQFSRFANQRYKSEDPADRI